MQDPVVVFGYGPIGRAVTALLTARGRRVRVAQRSAPEHLPAGASFLRCDVTDAASVAAAAQGAAQIVLAVGFRYSGRIWRRDWPRAMRNVLAAAEANAARVVFFDNLYMDGAQDEPLREDMPFSGEGLKPAARAEVTRIWQEAAQVGRVRIAVLRAPDFYGPGVRLSHIGDAGIGAVARGRTATLIAPPDTPHDFAYVPDLARNVLTLLDAPDDAYGQVWHAPCAPTRTPRQILQLAARTLGTKARISAVPLNLLPLIGLVSPFLREMNEMRFQWDRPYRVDFSRWAARFGANPTPFETGVRETALWFHESLLDSDPAAFRGFTREAVV